MKNNIIVFVLLSFSILIGCSTPYQRKSCLGGFSETQLQENIFTVYFNGNGYTSRERASDFALLRCAEVVLENGKKYFQIMGADASQEISYYNTGGVANTTGRATTYGQTTNYRATTYSTGGTSIPIVKPASSYTILLLDSKPEGDSGILNAEFLAKSLKNKYGLQ